MRFTPDYIEDWEQLRKMLSEGEHASQDFKQSIVSKEKIARTLSAFANGNGGRLLVGVDDNGNIKGADPEQDMYVLHEAAEHYCDPPVDLEFIIHEEDGVEVLEARVLKSLKKPHAARDEKGVWQVFVRVGDETLSAGNNQQHQPMLKWHSEERETALKWLQRNGSISDLEWMKLKAIPRADARRMMEQAVAEGWLTRKLRNGMYIYQLR
jgi:predicted HTH transcriptional regulator